jgi:hypothetical protein
MLPGETNHRQRGSAGLALVFLVAVVMGSMLMLHTAAVISVGNTARALDLAQQNLTMNAQLEQLTAEATLAIRCVGYQPSTLSYQDVIQNLAALIPRSGATVAISSVPSTVPALHWYPVLGGTPEALGVPSADLLQIATPELRELMGGNVAESTIFDTAYQASREVRGANCDYDTIVSCQLVAVPLSRYRIAGYDMPGDIGAPAAPVGWPSGYAAPDLMPRGLVPARDPAALTDLATSPNRPGHYRRRALLAEAYQYVFSQRYYDRIADYSGRTHFCNVDGSVANPILTGGSAAPGVYSLDVGLFGQGQLGALTRTSSAGVFYSTMAGSRLILSDSVGSGSAVFLLVLGPAHATSGQIELEFSGSIGRPIVIVAANANVTAGPGTVVNGALFLDPQCRVSAGNGPVAIGHVSYWLGSTAVSTNAFRPGTMPVAAAALSPRVIYAVAATRSP